MRHYHQQSNAESTFSMVKAKFRDHVRSRTDVAMTNEVLCKFLCHNLCAIHRSHLELGIAPVFWGDRPAQATAAAAAETPSGRAAGERSVPPVGQCGDLACGDVARQ